MEESLFRLLALRLRTNGPRTAGHATQLASLTGPVNAFPLCLASFVTFISRDAVFTKALPILRNKGECPYAFGYRNGKKPHPIPILQYSVSNYLRLLLLGFRILWFGNHRGFNILTHHSSMIRLIGKGAVNRFLFYL